MSWTRRLLGTLRGRQVDRDAEEEIQFHLEMRARELTLQGVPPDEALKSVKRRFGNVTRIKEQTRDADVLQWLEDLVQDVVFALRTIRHSPVVTAVAVLSLALTLGANTVMFTVVDAVVLKPLPVRNPNELVLLKKPGRTPGFNVLEADFQHPLFDRLRTTGKGSVDLFGSGPIRRVTASIGGEPEEIYQQAISGDAFAVLGVRAILGRTLNAEDDNAGSTAVAVISHGFWQRRFGGDPSVLKKSIELGNRPYQIAGVTEPQFFGVEVGSAADLWTPMAQEPVNLLFNRSPWVQVMGRLKPVVTPAQAYAPLQRSFSLMLEEQAKGIPPDAPQEIVRQFLSQKLAVFPGARGTSPLRERLTDPLAVVFAVAALVLCIACTNLANLLLARWTARKREMAMRAALGAGRGRLIRQVLTESLLLATLSSALGLWCASMVVPFLVKQLVPGGSPVWLALGVGWRVLGFSVAACVFATLLSGLLPAWRASRVDITSVIKGVETGGRARAGRLLVCAQVAISLLLVIGATFFVGTWRNLVALDPGFDRENLQIVMMRARGHDHDERTVRRLWEEALRRASAVPGVRGASISGFSLFSGNSWIYPVRLPGESPDEEDPGHHVIAVSNGYFQTMGTRLIRGRDFDIRDMAAQAPYVAVVNETFARRYFRGRDPIGKKFASVDLRPGTPAWLQIIGVVEDTKYSSLRNDPPAISYLPIFHLPSMGAVTSAHIEARTDPNSGNIADALRREIAGAGPNLQVERVAPLSRLVDDTLVQERLLARLSGFFGATALLLACVGLYGLMNYSVMRRTGEIGTRMAMGAPGGAVFSMILKESLLLVIAGMAIGIAAALALTRFVASLLFGMSGHEPATIAVAVLVMLTVAAVAGYLPARRASRMDPLDALRCE